MRVLVFLLITLFPGLSHAAGSALLRWQDTRQSVSKAADGRYCKQSLETVRVVSQPEGFLLAFSELRHA